MIKTSATISDFIVHCYDPKLGYTPPRIFKQRARLIKLVAEASMALNEHMKVTDDRDFLNTLHNDNEEEWAAAINEVVNEREELEYNLAYHMNNLFYYDQEEWSQSGHDCESIMSNTAEEWERRGKEQAA